MTARISLHTAQSGTWIADRAAVDPEASMRTHTPHRPARRALLLGGMALLTACVTSSPPSTRPRPWGAATTAVITQDEIVHTRANSAYEAIQLSRPVFLMSRVDLAPLTEREVYLDGMLLGGIDQLRRIAASSVREIRFVRAQEVGSGMGRLGGAILVTTKVGR
jgi:hypothetical protein